MNRRIYRAIALTLCSALLITGAAVFNVKEDTIEPSLIAGISNITTVNVTEAAELYTSDVSTTGSMNMAYEYPNLGIANVSENLNIREEPSESGKIIGKMMNNAGCEIEEELDGWYLIKSGEVEGYVCADYVITGDEAYTLANEIATTLAEVTTTTLRVREEPSTDSTILTTVSEGVELEVQEQVDGWIKVAIDEDIGYISGDYVNITTGLQTAMTLNEFRYGAGVSDVRVDLVNYALQFVGNPYVWGGTSLTNGADCSGFVLSIYKKYGISLPHSSSAQANYGTRISASQAKPGDLFFYSRGGSGIGHVGIYIGNGQIVHASSAKTGIKISSAYYRTPLCVVNLLGND